MTVNIELDLSEELNACLEALDERVKVRLELDQEEADAQLAEFRTQAEVAELT